MPFRHGKNTGVLINAYNLSTYFTDAKFSASVETAETTTFGVAGGSKTYVTGLNDQTTSLSGLLETSANAVDAALSAALGGDTPILFTIANDGGFTLGRRCSSGIAIQTKYEIDSPVADVVKISCDFQSAAESMNGVILAPLDTVTATGNNTAVDNTTSTANGGVGIIHVPANTRNGTIVVKIQHSSDNVTFADLVTFTTVSATTTTSERIVVAAGTTVNRYLRASYTVAGSSGSATVAVAFARRP